MCVPYFCSCAELSLGPAGPPVVMTLLLLFLSFSIMHYYSQKLWMPKMDYYMHTSTDCDRQQC